MTLAEGKTLKGLKNTTTTSARAKKEHSYLVPTVEVRRWSGNTVC